MQGFFRKLVYAMTVVMVLVATGVSAVTGMWPAPVPTHAPDWSLTPFAEALRSVDDQGRVDLVELKKRHAALSAFLTQLEATSPDTQPERFPTVEDRLAYWLNAYHALVLAELLETRRSTASPLAPYLPLRSIGGQRLTRFAIERNLLSQTGDARMPLVVATGEKGRGVLDGAPFDGALLGLQLDDAVRRFVRRRDHVRIEDQVVRVSALFKEHEAEFLAALPDERKHLLQVVWAYLPETCDDEGPGCQSRADLDRVCGVRFDRCRVEWLPIDPSLNVRN